MPRPVTINADPLRRCRAPELFIGLLTLPGGFGFRPRTARLLWDMIALSPEPEARAFCFQSMALLAQAVQPDRLAGQRAFEQYCRECLRPDLLRGAIDELVARAALQPAAAARLQQRIEALTDTEGNWLPHVVRGK
jgi:hypothetical protein